MSQEEMKELPAAQREEFWDELTINEQVERMRGIVKHLSSRLQSVRETTNDLLEHLHHGDELVIPLKQYIRSTGSEKLLQGYGKDKDYF